MDVSDEYKALVNYLEDSYYDDVDAKGLVINADKVLLSKAPEGIKMIATPIEDGVEVLVEVEEGVQIDETVHMCFGMLPREGRQVIKSKYIVHRGASVKFLSHCVFPNAINIEHIMDSEVVLEENSHMSYLEEHIHGESGGIKVYPRAHVFIGRDAYYETEYSQKKGRAGILEVDYTVDVDSGGKAHLMLKAYGRKDDRINSHETIRLNGEGASGIIKSRVILRDDATSEIWNVTEGNAPGSRGHVDCTEIILDRAQAKAIPLVYAKDPNAKVTHEAAIGSVDSKQLMTLMARGLDEDQAIESIVQGMLE